MPVVIRGNTSSGILIVFIHGGPGGTGLKKIGVRAFKDLERDFGVVYWDQRGGENARGGNSPNFMTLDQFTEDIDVLISHLNQRHPHSRIFLMGHCWGGGLGTAYLSDCERQNKISGWIDVAGSHNNPKGDSLSIEWVKQYALSKIDANENAGYWSRALKWYHDNPRVKSNDLGHYQFVRKAHGYQLIEGDSLGAYPGYTIKDLLIRPVKYVSYYLNYYTTLNRFIISDIDLTSQMHQIKIPSLILWGQEDGLIPVPMAYEAFDALGTPAHDKRLVLLEDTAHTIFYERPNEFVNAVRQFIQDYAAGRVATTNSP